MDKNFNLVRMADELRGLRSSDITFRTVPLASANYLTPTGQDAVLWDATAARALFNGLKNDTLATAKVPQPARCARRASSRSKVSLDVYNGTWTSGLSSDHRQRSSAALGFKVHRAGLNWSQHTIARTIIQYPPGQPAAARLLQKVLPGATVSPSRT